MTNAKAEATLRRHGRTLCVIAYILAALALAAAAAHADTAHWEGLDQGGAVVTCETVETVNVNSASMAELELLYRVGPVIAQRIIDGRPYIDQDELQAGVKGIGPKAIDANRLWISFTGETTLTTDVPAPDDQEGAPASYRRVDGCQ